MRFVALTVVLVACLPLVAQQDSALSEDEKILHALSRLTFGPRPGDIEAVKKIGLQKWVDRQVRPGSIDDGKVNILLDPYETLKLTPKGTQDWIGKQKNQGRARRAVTTQLRNSILFRARYSERQLLEVAADFWRNHFNVDVAKSTVQQTATHYEYGVLRRYLFGTFHDLLLGTARHPAMLVYLDNHLSRRRPTKSELNTIKNRVKRQTGSKERAEQRVAIARQTGLNENYARELMELHTLGVDNGYTQKDVVEVSKALTGWTVDREAGETWFRYRDDLHEKGQKQLMGRQLPVGRRESGIIEGEAILKRLAAHKNTSEFIARKLCRRFVSDTPTDAIVRHVAAAFRKTNGDLKEVTRAMIAHPEFFSRRNYQSKFKTPLEFVMSALRVTKAHVGDPRPVFDAIKELGLELYSCEDPTGFSDATEDWRDPGVMALRWRFALSLSSGKIKGLSIPASFYDGLPDDLLEVPGALALRILPQGMGSETGRVLERVLFSEVQKAGSPEKLPRTKLLQLFVGILLGSPEFQQQ